jgi:hypothetical protein
MAARLPELLPRAIAWAGQQSQHILQSGAPLDVWGLAVARAVSVCNPERIRIWTVMDIPAPTDPELRRLALEQNLIGPGTRGLTLRYGIFIRDGEFGVTLLSHECRHVHQMEVVGSLEAFLPAYLIQIAEFGYDHAPYELDAHAHEIDAWPAN